MSNIPNFIRISEAKKQGIALAIDYHDQFASKSRAREAAQNAAPKQNFTNDVNSSFTREKSIVKPKSSSVAKNTASPAKGKSSTKGKGRRSIIVKPTDKVRWITVNRRRVLVCNGKKLTGKKAMMIYKEYKVC